jgi:ATP-dependent RNA helicase DeaD
VRISHGGGAPTTVVLYDLPASREELSEAMGASAKRVIGLIQPRQLSSLKALAGGGRLRPVPMPETGSATRKRDEMIRTELRTILERGTSGRTIFAIEPLLDEFDGVDIAAAALELLEAERSKPRATAAVQSAPSGGMVRLFFSVGERDGLRIGEVVASIGNDAGVPSPSIGKIDVRDSHTIVEVAADAAPQVIERLTGKTMSGRRLIVRPDQDSGERPARREGGKREGAPRRDGPPSRGGFGERRPPRGDGPPRGKPSGPRGASAGRPPRPRPRPGSEG